MRLNVGLLTFNVKNPINLSHPKIENSRLPTM